MLRSNEMTISLGQEMWSSMSSHELIVSRCPETRRTDEGQELGRSREMSKRENSDHFSVHSDNKWLVANWSRRPLQLISIAANLAIRISLTHSRWIDRSDSSLCGAPIRFLFYCFHTNVFDSVPDMSSSRGDQSRSKSANDCRRFSFFLFFFFPLVAMSLFA